MKKIIAILLSLSMTAALLAGCSKGGSGLKAGGAASSTGPGAAPGQRERAGSRGTQRKWR